MAGAEECCVGAKKLQMLIADKVSPKAVDELRGEGSHLDGLCDQATADT